MSVIQTLLRNPILSGEEPKRLSSSWLDNPYSESFVDHGEPIFDQHRMDEYERARACEDEESQVKAHQELEDLAAYMRKNSDRRGLRTRGRNWPRRIPLAPGVQAVDFRLRPDPLTLPRSR